MQPLHPLAQKLLDIERLKTWSVIVTLFGDFDGSHLTGSQIREILGHLGIKPAAIRVALHRLKTDTWIAAEKQGREAIYRLSPKGRRETDAASIDVYRKDIKFPHGWQFYLLRDGAQHAFAIPVTKELVIAPTEVSQEIEESIILKPQPQDMPVWIEQRLVPHHLLQNAKAIVGVLQGLSVSTEDMRALDARCLRLLVVHQWRRLALRPGTWAHIGLLPEGILSQCHSAVTAYLDSVDAGTL